MTHDIAGLERKLRALDEAISKFHSAKHAQHLITIIHRPGWTTLREPELAQAYAESLHSRVSDLHRAFDTLTPIAEKIGRE